MIPDLNSMAEAIRSAIRARVADADLKIAQLQVQQDTWKHLLQADDQIVAMARAALAEIDQSKPVTEAALIEVFRDHGPSLRWTAALEFLVAKGYSVSPSGLIDTLKSNPDLFSESRQGWWRMTPMVLRDRSSCSIPSPRACVTHLAHEGREVPA